MIFLSASLRKSAFCVKDYQISKLDPLVNDKNAKKMGCTFAVATLWSDKRSNDPFNFPFKSTNKKREGFSFKHLTT